MQELDAEQKRLEIELENERQAQDLAKQQRKVQHELELANQKIQFMSGSQADDNEFVDPLTSPSRSTQLTPPDSRLDLNGGFNVPNSVSLPAREGDAFLGTGFPSSPSTFSRAVGQQRQTFPSTESTQLGTVMNTSFPDVSRVEDEADQDIGNRQQQSRSNFDPQLFHHGWQTFSTASSTHDAIRTRPKTSVAMSTAIPQNRQLIFADTTVNTGAIGLTSVTRATATSNGPIIVQ